VEIREMLGNMKKSILIILLGLMAINCYSQNASLIGKWFFEEFIYYDFVVVEFSQTKISILELEDEDEETFNYRINGKNITFDGDTYQFEIKNGNVLRITDGDSFYDGNKLSNAPVKTFSGTFYLANDEGFLEEIEFRSSSTARLHYDIFGTTTRFTAQYRINGSDLIITGGTGDTIILEIISDKILVGDTMGGLAYNSIFIKK